MAQFWKHVNDVIEESGILIEVLDARQVQQSRNIEIEHKVLNSKKILLYVINKIDLAKKEDIEKYKRILRPSVFISSTQKLGTTILKKKIRELTSLNSTRTREAMDALLSDEVIIEYESFHAVNKLPTKKFRLRGKTAS